MSTPVTNAAPNVSTRALRTTAAVAEQPQLQQAQKTRTPVAPNDAFTTAGAGAGAALKGDLRSAPMPSGDGDVGDLYTREQFVNEMKDKSISVKDGIKGLDVGKADLNADGVISGAKEADALFSELDRKEKAKTGKDAVALEPVVQGALDQLRAAPNATAQKPAVSVREREQMGYAIDGGEVHMDRATSAAGQKDYLGRTFSRDAIAVDVTAGAGKGATVIHDPKLGFFMKSENGKAVPMTQEEVKAFAKTVQANHPERNERGPYDGANDTYKRLYIRMFPASANDITLESPT